MSQDTVFRSFQSPITTFSARRRTTYVFHTSPDIPQLYLVDNTPKLWEEVRSTLAALNPSRIAVNVDEDSAFSDGLHTGEGRVLMRELGDWAHKVSSERMLGVEIVAARSGGREQLDLYRMMQQVSLNSSSLTYRMELG